MQKMTARTRHINDKKKLEKSSEEKKNSKKLYGPDIELFELSNELIKLCVAFGITIEKYNKTQNKAAKKYVLVK